MEKLFTILQVIAPIALAVYLGMEARKKNWFAPEVIQGFQDFVVKICLPCLLFQSCLTADIGPQTVSSMVLILPFLLLNTLWAFRFGRKQYPYHNLPMLLCCKETGMIGIPLFMILFGAENAYYMGILDLAQAASGFTVIGILSAASGKATSPKEILREMSRSTLIRLSLLGVVLNLTGVWDWITAIGAGDLVTETLSFLSQPVSLVMLFCVGFNFSLRKENRSHILKVSATHFAMFAVMGIVIQLALGFLPGTDAMTRWSMLLYCLLPASYLAPGLGRREEDAVLASGVCSVLTVVCLLSFFVMAIFTA